MVFILWYRKYRSNACSNTVLYLTPKAEGRIDRYTFFNIYYIYIYMTRLIRVRTIETSNSLGQKRKVTIVSRYNSTCRLYNSVHSSP